jgi:hypothetical protein
MRPTSNTSAQLTRSPFARTRHIAPTLALLVLSNLVCKSPACAAGATGPVDASPPPALPAIKGSQDARPIVHLLQRLDREVVEDHLVEPHDDNVSQTLETIIGLLKQAPAEDLQLMIDLPSHLARRGDQAAGSGRGAEAQRFWSLAAIVSRSSPGDAAGRTLTQIPQIPAPGKDPAALAEPSPIPVPAQDAASLPQGKSAAASQPLAPTLDASSAMKEPSATDAALAALPDILNTSGRASSEFVHGLLAAPSQLPTVFVTPPLPRKVLAVPQPRVIVPPTTRTPVRGTAESSRCRIIAQKFEIGEVPSEAERGYLREGCQGG